MKHLYMILFLFFLIIPLWSISGFDSDANKDGKIDQWCTVTPDGKSIDLKSDTNFDGAVDYTGSFTSDWKVKYEEYDYNNDGKMDTFNYYKMGLLIRQEIDSNFDGNVDIWVYLHNNVYIERYEIDSDFDGKVDQIKDYSKKK